MSIASKIKCPYCGADMDLDIYFDDDKHKKQVIACEVCAKDFILHSWVEVIHDYQQVKEKDED